MAVNQVNVASALGVAAPASSGVDLETLFMSLGFERTQVLDNVVSGQMTEMSKRNDQIRKLNDTLNLLRAAAPGGGKDAQVEITGEQAQKLAQQLKEQGIELPAGIDTPEDQAKELQDILKLIDGRKGLSGYHGDIWWRAPEIIATAEKYGIDLGDIQVKTHSSGQKYVGPSGGDSASKEAKWEALEQKFREKIEHVTNNPSFKGTVDDFNRLKDIIKTDIDNLSSNSQLDMIKLQGLINKRNQAVEMLTNLIQKFQQTNNSIVGNMR